MNSSIRSEKFRSVKLGAAVLAAFVAAGSAHSDEPERWTKQADPVLQHYIRDNGLPDQVTTSVAQDGDGFLWVGTFGGLARWDGYRFRSYRPNPKDPGALPDSVVMTLHTDPRGRLWIGTSAGGLARYDRSHDRFVTYAAGAGGLSHAQVDTMADDGAGGLWIATGNGLDHLDPQTGEITWQRHDAQDPDSLPASHVLSVLRDHTGTIWVGTRAGLARREPATGKFVAVPLAAPPGPVLAVKSLFEDDHGRLWIGTPQGGAYVLDGAGGRARPVDEIDRQGSTARSDFITAISAGVGGEIWLGTNGQGIVAVEPATGRTRRMRHIPNLPDSLISDTIWNMFRDRAGTMWIATEAGLDRLTNGDTTVLTLFGASGREGSLANSGIGAILPMADGRIWLGSTGSIDIIDPAGAQVASLQPDPGGPKTALPKAGVNTMAEADGAVFIGTSLGLYRADLAGTKVQPVAIPKCEASVAVSALLTTAGSLWIGGLGRGVCQMSLRDGSLSLVGRWDEDRLTDGRIVTIQRGTADDVWIGTRNGLNRVDRITGAVERIPPDPPDPAALASGFVTSLLVDSRARLWIGTVGGGIHLLTHRDADGRPRFHRIGTAEGLPSANVQMLLQDTQGKIWASTGDGLAVIDPATFAVRALHRAEGVAFGGHYGGSGARTPQGELLFGAGDGVSVVRPERLKEWGYRPPVVVTDTRIGGQPVPAERFNGAGSSEPLLIASKANSLAVEFSALDYTAPERNRYAYKLEGFDTNWIETDPTRRLAVYTNLPPGNYALHLRGSNRDGVWTEKTVDLPIRVLPAWYQTLWFKLAMFGAGIAAVAVLVQARTAYLRQRQRELQSQVEARTAEVVHQKAVVEQQKAVVELRNVEVEQQKAMVELRNIEVEEQRAVAELAHRNISVAYRELGDTLLELQQTQAKLVQQEKLASLGQLVAGVAHEVNTPLGVALAASTQIADEVGRLDGVIASGQLRRTSLTDFMATLHELAELLARNCARASTLIQSFKAVAADRGSDERRRFDLRAYVEDVTKSVEPTLNRSHVKLVIAKGIEGAAPLTIDSYPGVLSQVIINLVTNALTHAFEPEQAGVITIRIALRDAAHAELTVRDDGKGIPPDVLPKIFDPFFTTRRGAGGTGLGLHIVHNLVTGPLGGSISVETAPASGTAFIVVIPLNAPSEPV